MHKEGIDGEGITVAVLDSAINIHNDDIKKSSIYISGTNFIKGKDGSGASKGDDYCFSNRESHGTMVTGVVACYAPKANVFICCVSEENKFKQDAIIKALEVIQADNKCQVVVMSFGHLSDKEYDNRKITDRQSN